MQLEIIPREALPCRLLTFTINGKDADINDFGFFSTFCKVLDDLIDHECPNGFVPYELPDSKVLEKYKISKEEYKEICKKLEDVLVIPSCGLNFC